MSKKRTTKAAPQISLDEAVGALMGIPEIAESFSRADLELALDDRGWINTSTSAALNAGEMDPTSRATLVRKSRLYWARDPLAKQAVRLWTDYALGNGVVFNAKDKGVQVKLNKWWKDRRNRRLLSSRGQRRLSSKLIIDGEIFFALYDDGTVRLLDCLQIVDVMVDPDDDEHILGYRRLLPSGKSMFYEDWALDDDGRALFLEQKHDSKPITVEEGVRVYHLPFDAIGQRGNGLLFCCLDYSREHRRFLEARISLVAALSKFAYKMSVKGGQTTIDAIKRRLESTVAAAGIERNPKTSAGSTWFENAGLELSQMPRTTGAGDAKTDGDNFKLMISAGTGIMLHYFGDPSTGNLATATAMELPMLKMFSSYQQLWIDAYRDLFAVVLDEDPDSEQAEIDIDLPPILAADLDKLTTSVQRMVQTFPELKIDEITQMVLVALGVNNVDQLMDRVRQLKAENATKAAALTQATQKLADNGITQESIGDLTKALVGVVEALNPEGATAS